MMTKMRSLLPLLLLLAKTPPRSAELSLLHGECRCTLIDVGLNDGSSLDYWQLPAAQRNYDPAFKDRHPKQVSEASYRTVTQVSLQSRRDDKVLQRHR